VHASSFPLFCRCVDGIPPGCAGVLRTTKFFPPSSRHDDLKDLAEVSENIYFTDERCRIALSFSACYLAFVPCNDSLPEPFCMDDCLLIDALRESFCPDEFRLVLKFNNSLSQDLGNLNCSQPSSYLKTTFFSSNCFALQKLGKALCVVCTCMCMCVCGACLCVMYPVIVYHSCAVSFIRKNI